MPHAASHQMPKFVSRWGFWIFSWRSGGSDQLRHRMWYSCGCCKSFYLQQNELLWLEEMSSNTGVSLPHYFCLWVLEELHAVGDLQGWLTFGVCELGDHYRRLGRAWWVMARAKLSDINNSEDAGPLSKYTWERSPKIYICVCVCKQAIFG